MDENVSFGKEEQISTGIVLAKRSRFLPRTIGVPQSHLSTNCGSIQLRKGPHILHIPHSIRTYLWKIRPSVGLAVKSCTPIEIFALQYVLYPSGDKADGIDKAENFPFGIDEGGVCWDD